MRKGVVIGIVVAIGLVALFGWAGWRILDRPIDPNSETGKLYAENFKKSFVENCATQIESHGAGDQEWHQKVGALCQCGADASYEELKDVSMPEQYAQLQTPEMKQKLGGILKACAQKVGLQLGGGSQ